TRQAVSGNLPAAQGRLDPQEPLRELVPADKATLLERELALRTAYDLLTYFPYRYEDLSAPLSSSDLRELAGRGGEAASEVNAQGEIVSLRHRALYGRRVKAITEAMLRDDAGLFRAVWFGRSYLGKQLAEGMRIFLRGRLQRAEHGASSRALIAASVPPTLNVSLHRVVREGESYDGEVLPVYRQTARLPLKTIRGVMRKALPQLLEMPLEELPESIQRKHRFMPTREAYRAIHLPGTMPEALAARRRVIFGEFLGLALGAAIKRAQRAFAGGALPMSAAADLLAQLEGNLPFALTGAQRRVIGEIWGDMARPQAMNRLLQGDVGSGKTLVAAAAALLAHRAGAQTALMAPTEILARQHAAKLATLLLPFGVPVEVVLGGRGAKARREALGHLADGGAALVIGTHALLEDDVIFARLGLAIIDEQHKFGVEQRRRLRIKGYGGNLPHTLVMTATPIPRTLAQSLYADLDLSLIDELPPGRSPIQTRATSEARKAEVYAFVRKQVEQGRQAYVVTPSIGADGKGGSNRGEEPDESKTALARALEVYEDLRGAVFPDLRVGLLHGRMGAREKDGVMAAFTRNEVQVLVATTVVEVGVDVSNASVMVVLDAQCYGLAQLHQLRGRVGRGAAKSFCILVAPGDRAESARLHILEETTDGFAIAEEDLRLRGMGDLRGVEQSGAGEFKIANLMTEFHVYAQAKAEADAIIAADPRLERPEHRGLLPLLAAQESLQALLVSS
ncbi:MAG: ATP-dependent DNA helicase RecG, partial [bacterium]|nr:ATP-dependent DNA helicase RecG [bacterium]